MKRAKKILSLVLTSLLLTGVVSGCGSTKPAQTPSDGEKTAEQTTAENTESKGTIKIAA